MHTLDAPSASQSERFVTAREVADTFGVTHRWVNEKARDGSLPSYKLPGSNRSRFLISEVQAKLRGA
jgi:predicted DNA-binding transcriptional regulator AlpA